jgi:two-component system, LytTR family, response regulator
VQIASGRRIHRSQGNSTLSGAAQARRIAVNAKGEIVFVYPAEIIALKADGDRLRLCHTSGPYLIREPLSSIAEKLSAFGFVRIHRSVVVNVAHIEELRRCVTGVYLVRVSGGKKYTITRTYKTT